MKKCIYLFIQIFFLLVFVSCEDFLDVPAKGIISDEQLATPENIDGLVIAAYAQMANDHYTVPNSLWPYGDLRAGDSYKGGDGPADIATFHAFEIFSTIQPDMSTYPPSALGDINNKMWERQFVGISRANSALARINIMDEATYPKKLSRTAEMRFLRGHYFFTLKILYKNIPWFDENVSLTDIEKISNVAYTDQELWDQIIQDFDFAANNLPASQEDVGRPNKFTAKAYLAKAYLYAAYEQDDKNNVISIDQDKLTKVVDLVDEVIGSDTYGLEADFAYPFLWENENGKESVWAIQRSINDGTATGNVDYSSMLNNPMSENFGCCGFHQPSQNLANSFKTDANGHPLFDTFNTSDIDFSVNTVDPRFDHSIAMPGKPWKYKSDLIYTNDWARRSDIYGFYSSMKENVSPDCECFNRLNPFMSSSKNTILIRFADVLLWKAEALIELNRESEAMPIINDIRLRAKQSTGLLKDSQNNALSNYNIEAYTADLWTNEYARKALQWERRLEFALEGQRFFDLVRWGIADNVINDYLTVEKTKRAYLMDAQFQKNKN
ncbi:MAG: RagB/SusD family nutrient uptake outer membrane protein [Salinivirgaceae bacterium]